MSSPAVSSWKSTFTNVPPLTKSVSTAVTVMTALGLVLRFRDMALLNHADNDTLIDADGNVYQAAEDALVPLLALVPVSYVLWIRCDMPGYAYAINITILLGSGKYLERAWGSREFFKFLAVTSVGTMLSIYFTCLFEYIVRGNEHLLYDTQAYGLTAVLAGFLIGFKQLVPEHLVTLWGLFSVRVKTLPMLFATFMIFESLLARNQVQLMMAIYGLFIAWVYSRFFKIQDGVRGDRSETFSFASFFPEAAQPPVKALSNVVFGIFVSLRILSPVGFGANFERDLENPQMPGMVLPMAQPASLRAEAERRRALALKALDMRLHAAAGNSASLPGLSQKTFLGPTPSAGNNPISFPTSLHSESTSSASKAATESDVLFETGVMDEDEPVTAATTQQPGEATSSNSDGKSSQ
ncbi:hypothetical protein BGZ99_009354 [Dissophora globulifera]|uniref:Rhomboid protein n=1 Tax=Dissophora globulifera TaxID=979702 RepID=A0A9P6R923_9FUNG|nr:hypothetical protein BGZ99_009354 [Dissophora globulifera]